MLGYAPPSNTSRVVSAPWTDSAAFRVTVQFEFNVFSVFILWGLQMLRYSRVVNPILCLTFIIIDVDWIGLRHNITILGHTSIKSAIKKVHPQLQEPYYHQETKVQQYLLARDEIVVYM